MAVQNDLKLEIAIFRQSFAESDMWTHKSKIWTFKLLRLSMYYVITYRGECVRKGQIRGGKKEVHIPKRTYSKKGTLQIGHTQKWHVLKRANSKKSTFQKWHIPKMAHSKNDTIQKEPFLFCLHSKNGTFQKEHMLKRAHPKESVH